MNITRRTKVITLSGILTMLALTVVGCQEAPNSNGTQSSVPAVEAAKIPASSLDPATVRLGETWVLKFGEDRAIATAAAEAGNKFLNVTFDQFPQYTVEGFVPKEENFIEVSNALKPFITAGGVQYLESEWANKKSLPVLSSGRTDKEGNRSHTYITEAGEHCTDSDKPYEVEPVANVLLTLTDENQVEVPGFESSVDVIVHCKEGGTLKGQMKTWFPLVQENGSWLVGAPFQSKPGAPFEMAK